MDVFRRQNFLRTIYYEKIRTFPLGEDVLVQSVRFPYPSFEKISFHRPFERFLRDGNHYPGMGESVIVEATAAEDGSGDVFARGKKPRNVILAADLFLLRKSVPGLVSGNGFRRRRG